MICGHALMCLPTPSRYQGYCRRDLLQGSSPLVVLGFMHTYSFAIRPEQNVPALETFLNSLMGLPPLFSVTVSRGTFGLT